MSSKQKNSLKEKITETLTATFSGLQNEMPPKKFKRNVKKASKALIAGFKIASPKKLNEKKKNKLALTA
jgi:hypothetical protein